MPITSGDGRIYMLLQNTGSPSGPVAMQLCVGTISGSSFSQTFRTTIQSGATAGQKIAYSPTQDQVIMVYSRNNGGSKKVMQELLQFQIQELLLLQVVKF